MSNSSNHSIVQIYKSRKTILEILESVYRYDTTEYNGFSLNEIDAMYAADQLDMLLTSSSTEKTDDNTVVKPIHKTYIKYFLKNNTLNDKSLSMIVEDLFTLSDTLTKKDTLIIIYDGEPNETLQYHLNHMYNHDGIFVVVHNIKRLQFNLLNHQLVPTVFILDEDEIKQLEQKYHLTKIATQLPEISRFDPMALVVCLRPLQVCRLLRSSPTALTTEYYRICI
jgi:DNA-directed RNA polymerase subunit H (RpoH/RPB5)